MLDDERIERGKLLIDELAGLLQGLSDKEVPLLLGQEQVQKLIHAILDPVNLPHYRSLHDYFIANKYRGATLTRIHYCMTDCLGSGHDDNGETIYATPKADQWYDDGIILLEGYRPFEGRPVRYVNGKPSFAVIKRDIPKGEMVGPEDIDFVDQEIAQSIWQKLTPPQLANLDDPINELEGMLEEKVSAESSYQELLSRYPWVFGLHYSRVNRHEGLDGSNIPDFTAVRATDSYRDIIEIKPPTMPIVLRNGGLSSEFNNAWNQAERYLNFARTQQHYLQHQRGLRFDNPRCFLICGFELDEESLREIRVKERMNPAIQLMTYDDMLAYMRNTVSVIRSIIASGRSSEQERRDSYLNE